MVLLYQIHEKLTSYPSPLSAGWPGYRNGNPFRWRLVQDLEVRRRPAVWTVAWYEVHLIDMERGWRYSAEVVPNPSVESEIPRDPSDTESNGA